MRVADFIFGRGLVMDVLGMHGRVDVWLCGMGLQENGGTNDGNERRYIDEMLRTK
jgi:hypothetical protein